MCGIAGYFGPAALSETALDQTLTGMRHRGPDGARRVSIPDGAHNVQMLHTRLAILDPQSRSDQPFEGDGCTLIFNGEIYNFVELREQLQKAGCIFSTTGDTEVILKAYRIWGRDCVTRFEGMFAFALYDSNRRGMLLARDGFGEKPLFICRQDGGLFFGSEIKFLQAMGVRDRGLNQDKMRRFLLHGYRTLAGQNDSFHNGIDVFPSGAAAWITDPGQWNPDSYWRLDYLPDRKMSWRDAVDECRERLETAIRIRLRADTDLALTLSGGVDSNVLAGIAQNLQGQSIHCFSMLDSEEGINEEPLILKAVESLGCEHYIKRVGSHDFLPRLRDLVRQHNAPISTIAMYLDSQLAKSVAQHGYKVALNGMGSDEIFTGYYDHYLYYLSEEHARSDYPQKVEEWRNSIGRWIKNPLFKNPDLFHDKPGFRDHVFLSTPAIADFVQGDIPAYPLEREFCGNLLRNRMLNELFRETVPNYLLTGDHNWMAHSVEARSVYLDRELARFLFTVPSHLMFKNGCAKALLREAGRGLVPPEILDMPRKTGFNAPLQSLLPRDDREAMDFLLSDSPLYEIIDKDRIEPLLRPDTPLDGLDNFLFSVVSAQLFYLS